MNTFGYLDENLISYKSQRGKTEGQSFGTFFFSPTSLRALSVETFWKSQIFQQNKRNGICPSEQICSETQGITQVPSEYKLGMERKTLEMV